MTTMHHACLLKLRAGTGEQALLAYGDTSGLEIQYFLVESLGIGEVRNLILQASRRPVEGSTTLLLVVCVPTITFEAQQALLKVLEEPPVTTKFLFCVSDQFIFLPTVTSRFHEIFLPGDAFVLSKNIAFTAFERQSYADRLLDIGKRMTKKDMVWLQEIKQGLSQYLSDDLAHSLHQIKTMNLVLVQLGSRGASNKMLLEALALILPVGAQK
jgi:DNA polymerase III, delta subunit